MNDNCFIETRIVSALREAYGDLLQVNSGLNHVFHNRAGAMRAQAWSDHSLKAILRRTAIADVRINLWLFGGLLVSGRDRTFVPDAQPLRSFWPEKFVEPMRMKLTKTGVEFKTSFWWKIAPFELRLVENQGTVGEWTIREDVWPAQVTDSNSNTVTDQKRYLGQLTREFKFFKRTQFVRIFRWNPFK